PGYATIADAGSPARIGGRGTSSTCGVWAASEAPRTADVVPCRAILPTSAMIAILVAAQVVLPLLMLLCLAFQPAAIRLVFALQSDAIGALLLSMEWAAAWTLVTWWLPRVHSTLWVAATLWHVLHGRAVRVTLLPARSVRWSAAALSAALLVIGAW